MESFLVRLTDEPVPEGNLSRFKRSLIGEVKEFVDRISDKPYPQSFTSERIHKSDKIFCELKTWGEYFQLSLSLDAAIMDDEDFSNFVCNLKFDIMAAWDIVSSNDAGFLSWIDEMNSKIMLLNKEVSELNVEEQEIVHLKTLVYYFADLGINGNFNEREKIWYRSFLKFEGQLL